MKRATPEDVKKRLDAGEDVNARDEYDATPLHYAVLFNKNLSVIDVLVQAGADVNATCSVDIKDGVSDKLEEIRSFQKKQMTGKQLST
ncbi:MAG: ankyrin repeat domain-containing protein [Alphaproteobacteria bacterium GM202ARS2]|nr:ankyrin repeat domain-containing protein [Alphaproteobacteria bacterium GM202ARS2]